MYICPCCKKEVKPNVSFCGNCGVQFAVNSNNVGNANSYQQAESQKSLGGWKAVSIILIIVLALAVTVGGVFGLRYLFMKGPSVSEDNIPADSNPAQSSVVAEDSSSNVRDEYMLYGSDSRYITESELTGMSEWELRVARNEIFARHGRRFKDTALQSYFDNLSWYYGYISPENFKEDSLNKYEKANLDVIIEFEKEMGYRE